MCSCKQSRANDILFYVFSNDIIQLCKRVMAIRSWAHSKWTFEKGAQQSKWWYAKTYAKRARESFFVLRCRSPIPNKTDCFYNNFLCFFCLWLDFPPRSQLHMPLWQYTTQMSMVTQSNVRGEKNQETLTIYQPIAK